MMVKIAIHYTGLAMAGKMAYFNDLTKLVCNLT
jgi:hypothetical protein